MRFSRSFVVLSITTLAIASAAIAFEPADAPTTKPVKEKPIRLTTPWNKVKDLSDEQKKQINEVHVDTIEKIKALEAEEDEKCMALLTPEQQKALEETIEKDKADKKAAKKK
jgi:Spy/CpxP family protein refolding chaperone